MTDHTELRDRIRRAVYERLAHGPSAPDVLDPIADAAMSVIAPELERERALREEAMDTDRIAIDYLRGEVERLRAELERMRPRVWLTGDTIPGGVVTIAGPDDTPLVWPSDTIADGDEVEVPIPDYHAAVARARRERTATEDTHDRPRDRMVRIGRVDRDPDRQVRSLAWLLWTASRYQWSREGCATEAARWLHDLTPTPKPTQSEEATDA